MFGALLCPPTPALATRIPLSLSHTHIKHVSEPSGKPHSEQSRCLILLQSKQGELWVQPAEISMGSLCPGCWLTAAAPPELQEWVKGLMDKALFIIQWLQGKGCDWELLYLPVQPTSVTRVPRGVRALLYVGINPTNASLSFHGLAIKRSHYYLLRNSWTVRNTWNCVKWTRVHHNLQPWYRIDWRSSK